MPCTSPGAPDAPTPFTHIFPGPPTESLQATATFIYRFTRYVAYLSGPCLHVSSAPSVPVQALSFSQTPVAVVADATSGKLIVASKKHVWVLEPIAEGWSKIRWEKKLALRRDDSEDDTHWLSVGREGEVLVAGSRALTLFSILPSSRTSSPRTSAIGGEAAEDRKPLWSKPLPSPLSHAEFSPTSTLIATCSRADRLVKIWRRLSFEEGLFDHTYLPHPAFVTHLQWRPLAESTTERRGSGISSRHEEEPEVLYTIASDGYLRVWRTAGLHDLDILVLYTSINLVAAIPDSPRLAARGVPPAVEPPRYAVVLPCDQFSAAVLAAIGLPQNGKISHSKEFLKEMVSQNLDIIITHDGQGRMSAWGLQRVGHKRRPDSTTAIHPIHIAHAEGLSMRIPAKGPAVSAAWFQHDQFHLLMHTFAEGGAVSWWKGSVESFFSPSATGQERLSCSSKWCGVEINEWSGKDGATPVDANKLSITGSQAIRGHPQLTVTIPAPSDPLRSYVLTVSGQGCMSGSRQTSGGDEIDDSKSIADSETGLLEPAVSAASADFVAVVSSDLRSLIILDRTEGYLEHQQVFDGNITCINCFAPEDGRNMIAVGFAYNSSVRTLAQGRYDTRATNAWHTTKLVSLVGLGLEICGLQWRLDGSLAVKAGEGLYITGSDIELESLEDAVRDVVRGYDDNENRLQLPRLAEQLKKPLAIWHPDMLTEFVYGGHESVAVQLLAKLAYKLKFWSKGEILDSVLDQDCTSLFRLSNGLDMDLDPDTVAELKDQLEEKGLPFISRTDQRRLHHIIDAIVYVRRHVQGLDHNALRYLFNWRLQLLEASQNSMLLNGPSQAGNLQSSENVPEMQWREVTFAYHSKTQQPLLDILMLHHDNKLSWYAARRLGIMAWISDREALKQAFEQLAQTAYRSEQPPDPVNAAIYYLALHKKETLMALWRIATWHREQRTTVNFLKKDFGQPEAKTAARKNAYALMGKRRFPYSAAFFLLADDAASACNVLASQCGDVHFAIAVARMYCGDGSPVLLKLLSERLLPQAKQMNDRWAMSWYHSVLLQKEAAAEDLIEDLGGVRRWQQDDPATLLLYKQLRKTSSAQEYRAVRRAARVLRRQGLWIPALELVRTWEFTSVQLPSISMREKVFANGFRSSPDLPEPPEVPQAELIEPPSFLNNLHRPEPSRSSPKDDQAAREAKAAELLARIKAKREACDPSSQDANGEGGGKGTKKLEQPTQFKEPDANSLLDAFGF